MQGLGNVAAQLCGSTSRQQELPAQLGCVAPMKMGDCYERLVDDPQCGRRLVQAEKCFCLKTVHNRPMPQANPCVCFRTRKVVKSARHLYGTFRIFHNRRSNIGNLAIKLVCSEATL